MYRFLKMFVILMLSLFMINCTTKSNSDVNSLDQSFIKKHKRTESLVLETINFAGYTWTVKSGYCSVGNKAGPGPNYYCGDEEDLWVDGNGYLHMKMNYKSALSHYGCVSIKTLVSGCGTYTYSVGNGPNGTPDSIDENAVIGLFTYDESVSDNGEIDIEISDWGDSTPDANLWFVTWLNSSSTNDNYLVEFGSGTVLHNFVWSPSYITFRSTKGGVLLGDGVRTGSAVYDCPTAPIYVRINFWLVDGEDPASSQEIVIEDFEFTPLVLLEQPTSLSASTESSSSISLSWNDTSSGEYGYKIYSKELGGEYSLLTTTEADAVYYLDENLDSDTTYVYKVVAVNNGSVEGPYSSEAQATTDGVDAGAPEPSLSTVGFSCVGWYGYVSGTISDLPDDDWHVRTWILTNQAYKQGKDLTVDVDGDFTAEHLWCTPGPAYKIWITVHNASTDIYGTGDAVTMSLGDFPDEAEPDYVFGPFDTD